MWDPKTLRPKISLKSSFRRSAQRRVLCSMTLRSRCSGWRKGAVHELGAHPCSAQKLLEPNSSLTDSWLKRFMTVGLAAVESHIALDLTNEMVKRAVLTTDAASKGASLPWHRNWRRSCCSRGAPSSSHAICVGATRRTVLRRTILFPVVIRSH